MEEVHLHPVLNEKDRVSESSARGSQAIEQGRASESTIRGSQALCGKINHTR